MAKKSDDSFPVSKPYTKTPDGLWLCPEFNLLKESSQSLYRIMLAYWNPYKPKEPFALPYDIIRSVTCWSPNKISKAIKQLDVEGWIKIVKGGRFPHNVSLYRIELEWLEKPYPKVRKTLPEYMSDYDFGDE